MKVSSKLYVLATLPPLPQRMPNGHWRRGGVGATAGLYAVAKREKSLPLPGIENRSSSP